VIGLDAALSQSLGDLFIRIGQSSEARVGEAEIEQRLPCGMSRSQGVGIGVKLRVEAASF